MNPFAEENKAKYASEENKKRCLELVQNPHIRPVERSGIVGQINKLDNSQVLDFISRLEKAIEKRTAKAA